MNKDTYEELNKPHFVDTISLEKYAAGNKKVYMDFF